EVRGHPGGLRADARPEHAAAAPAVRGRPERVDRRASGGDRMSEPAPPGVAEAAAGRGPPALSVEAVRALADFREWLAAAPPAEPPAAPAADEPDLHTLLGQFLALRHEVNLQTKATRAQQEQNAETLRQLTEALDALERSGEAAEEARTSADEERL